MSSSPSKKLKESNKINLSPLKNVGKSESAIVGLSIFVIVVTIIINYFEGGKNVYVPPEMVFHTTEDLRVWQAEKKEEYNREV